MTVTLRPLGDADRQAVEALRVAPGQERFVSSVTDSLAEAAEHPEARAITWAVHDGDTPVGFVMVADEVGAAEYISRYLWKLLIDERYQRQGYGTAALDQVVAWFSERPGAEVLTTSAGLGEGSPLPFYERYGFVRTGELWGDEVLLRLDLRQSRRGDSNP